MKKEYFEYLGNVIAGCINWLGGIIMLSTAKENNLSDHLTAIILLFAGGLTVFFATKKFKKLKD